MPPTHEMPVVASYKATAGISERIVDWTISAANWRRLIWEWADSNCDWKAFHPIVWTHCLRSTFKTFLYTSHVPTLSLMLAREGRLSFSGLRSGTKVAVAPVFSIHTNINTTRTLLNNICVQWNCTNSVDFLCCQRVQKYYQFKDITQFFPPFFIRGFRHYLKLKIICQNYSFVFFFNEWEHSLNHSFYGTLLNPTWGTQQTESCGLRCSRFCILIQFLAQQMLTSCHHINNLLADVREV